MKIFKRFSGKVLYENKKVKTIKECLLEGILSDSDLSYSNLSYANLSVSDLSHSDLSYADLRYANLSYADLSYSDFSGSDFRDSDLSYSKLSYSDFSDSDFSGSNLSGSDFSYSKLFNATGNNKEIKTIQTGKYIINIVEDFNYIQIGCEQHTFKEWFSFTDREILKMDGKEALIWWKKWKPILISILDYRRMKMSDYKIVKHKGKCEVQHLYGRHVYSKAFKREWRAKMHKFIMDTKWGR